MGAPVAVVVGAGDAVLIGGVLVAAGGGWAIGRWIDNHTGISTALGNLLGGNQDELPASPVPKNMRPQHGGGDDPLNDLTDEELDKLYKDPKTPKAVTQKIKAIQKMRGKRRSRKGK